MDFTTIANTIAEYKGLDAADITPESRLAEDLGLDSLDTVELLMSFEEQLGVTLEMTEPMKTVDEVVAFIRQAVEQ